MIFLCQPNVIQVLLVRYARIPDSLASDTYLGPTVHTSDEACGVGVNKASKFAG